MKLKMLKICCNPAKRLLTFVLSLAIVFSPMSVTMPAYRVQAEETQAAAETLKPTVDNGKVTDAKILEYAGKQWYVIASGTTGVQIASGAVTTQDGATTLVLLAKENWDTAVFNDTDYKNAYGSSKLKTAVDGFVTSKSIKNYYNTDADKWKNVLIAQRKLEGGAAENNSNFRSEDKISGSGVDGVTLWPLSAAEVSQISNSTILQGNGNWWLRSPGDDDVMDAACVYSGSLASTMWETSLEFVPLYASI